MRVNVRSTYRVYGYMSLRFLALLPILTSGFAVHAQQSKGFRTFVEPLPDEEILQPCEYRMAPLETTGAVRAAWVIYDRGQDYLQWFLDRRIRAFANDHRLALILAMHCRSKEREDMIVEPKRGAGRALFTALRQFASSAARPELNDTGIIPMGWSGAGSLAGRLDSRRRATLPVSPTRQGSMSLWAWTRSSCRRKESGVRN